MKYSEDLALVLALCLSCLILFLGMKKIWKNGNLPPGPTPLPLLGNVLQIRRGRIVQSLHELREKYGDIFTVYLGSRRVVVVCGYKYVKEILVDRGDDYLARGDAPSFDTYSKNYGVVFTSNMERWRTLRRFSLSTLKDMGMGKRSTEDRIQEEASFLVSELKKTKESIFDPTQCLSKAPCNVLFSIMFGNRHDYEDEELYKMSSCINDSFIAISSTWGQLYEMFPKIMQYLPGGHTKIFRYLENLMHFVEEKVLMNQKNLDVNNSGSYVDAFLIRMEKERMDPHSEFHMANLVNSTLHIYFAGVETISTSLRYSMLILLKYPDILSKVHEEIDRVIGRNRSPVLQDRNKMPYTDAVIHEVQRYIDLIPMGVPRRTTTDTQLQGYSIPKGTNVFAMLGTVLRDPEHFPYPMEFNPKNFLDEDGQFKKNDAFMPLSAGKRVCLGEGLVRMELFLFFVSILQNFNLKSPVPPQDLDITPDVSGMGNFPKPFKIAFIPR